jgi:hypothetical protein
MISICVSVIRGVATRSKKSINESIVFIPSVRSDAHHKMRVCGRFESNQTARRAQDCISVANSALDVLCDNGSDSSTPYSRS